MLTLESTVPFALRFMIDKGIVGMGWMKVEGGGYTSRMKGNKSSSS